MENELADALSRSPVALASPDVEVLNINDLNSSSSNTCMIGSMRGVVDNEPERLRVFRSCHNSTQGHHGIQRTVMK